ncbi:MAG: hypothetical protein QOG96_3173, partial [Pseudonocardiales bacterium]|nr:hypothetical protein [Pseudonocardiales bacterium]
RENVWMDVGALMQQLTAPAQPVESAAH